MNPYGDYFKKRAEWCKNYKKIGSNWRWSSFRLSWHHQKLESLSYSNFEYEEAYKNAQEKKLAIKPCPETARCLGYLWAGADSGSVPFCGNFEDKEGKNR